MNGITIYIGVFAAQQQAKMRWRKIIMSRGPGDSHRSSI
jgi:hypothetical protein